MDMARAVRSMSPSPSRRPPLVVYAFGAATTAILGTAWLRRVASASEAAMPAATAARQRTASSMRLISASESIASISVPSRPIASARRRTIGLTASITVTVSRPTPGTSQLSARWPVGKSFPVTAPAGSAKRRVMRLPVPGTPSIA